MTEFAIIEVEDGLTIIESELGQTPEDIAVRQRGTLVRSWSLSDTRYEDALERAGNLEGEDEEE